MRLISAGSLVRAQSGPVRPAISQNWHTALTELSLEAFNLLPWTLTLCILRFFQSRFLKSSRRARNAFGHIAAPGPGLGKFLCEVEYDLRIAKATLGGELGFSL